MSYIDCLKRIAQAAGRELADDEVYAIYKRVHKAALDIKAGRGEPGDIGLGKIGKKIGVGKSQDQMIQEVAQRAAFDLVYEANFKERQAQLQVIAISGRADDMARLQQQIPTKPDAPFRAVDSLIARDYSGRTNIESVEQRVAGVRSDLKRQIAPVSYRRNPCALPAFGGRIWDRRLMDCG